MQEMNGLVFCKVLPPQNLTHAVLGTNCDGRFVFPLCMQCCKDKNTAQCNHTVEERAIEDTWCSVELQMALEKGYTILEQHEAWDFPRRTKDLFKKFIFDSYKDKMAASVGDDWDSARREKYLADAKKMGIDLRDDELSSNPAKRALAKFSLNNFWVSNYENIV